MLVGDFRIRLEFGNGDLHNGLGTRRGLFLHGRSGRPPGNQTLCRAVSVEWQVCKGVGGILPEGAMVLEPKDMGRMTSLSGGPD